MYNSKHGCTQLHKANAARCRDTDYPQPSHSDWIQYPTLTSVQINGQAMNRETEVSGIKNKMNPTEICGTFPPNTKEFVSFSVAHGTLFKIYHKLWHKSTNIGKLK